MMITRMVLMSAVCFFGHVRGFPQLALGLVNSSTTGIGSQMVPATETNTPSTVQRKASSISVENTAQKDSTQKNATLVVARGKNLGPRGRRDKSKETSTPQMQQQNAKRRRQERERRKKAKGGRLRKFLPNGSCNGTAVVCQKKDSATKETNFRCCRQVPLTNLSRPRKRRIKPISEDGNDGGNSSKDGDATTDIDSSSSNRSKGSAAASNNYNVTWFLRRNKCVDCRRVLLSTSEEESESKRKINETESVGNETGSTVYEMESSTLELKRTKPENGSSFRMDVGQVTVATTVFLSVSSTPKTDSLLARPKLPNLENEDDRSSKQSNFTHGNILAGNSSWDAGLLPVGTSDESSSCSNCNSNNTEDEGNRTAPLVILTEKLVDSVFTDAPEIWNQEKYLTKGINPNIEVSIEILHRDLEANKSGAQTDGESLLVSAMDQIIRSESEFTTTKENQGSSTVPRKQATEISASGRKVVDMCRQWMHCPGEKTLLDLARLETLPTCPCQYSFSVHYNEQIWDNRHSRFFRWRDASGPHDKLPVYQPGARWCIRSLVSETSVSLAAQHCCYDNNRCLITRGSGAGTPNFVSPEVSRDLHYQVDILPWIVCKGDWKRYHERRPPNNQNMCPENPNDQDYAKQEAAAKEF